MGSSSQNQHASDSPEGLIKLQILGLDVVALTCNPSTLGVQGGWIMRSGVQDQYGQDGETLSLLKIQKISQAW